MTRSDKDTIHKRTENRRLLQRMKTGLAVVTHTPYKGVLLGAYLVGAALVWLFRAYLFSLDSYGMFSPVLEAAINLLIPLYAVGGLLAFLALLGTPWGSKAAKEGLQKVGLVNHAGEAPALIAKRQDRDNPRLTIWEFDPCGIPLGEWEDKRARIETALDITIAKMTWAEGRKLIRVYAVPAKSDFPALLPWNDKYLSPESFVLVLGESLTGAVTVNLANIPHILLGGSTGSGKSVLLKLLLMQSLRKGAEVYIADFKGGVDFPKVWHQKCRMCFTEEDLLYTLGQLVAVLEYRKERLAETGCPNLDAYNEATGDNLPRLVFACDEVAELLDKTGRSKEEKEQVHTRLQAILEELSRTADEKQTKEALDKWSKSLPDEVENRLNEQVLLLNESWSRKLHILWQLLLQRIREYSDIDSVNLNLEMPQVDTSGPKLGWFGKEDEINQLKAQRDRWQKQADEADDEAERNQYNYEREQRNAQDKQRQYEKKKADADYRQRNLGSRPAPEYSTYTEKVYRGGLGFLDALLGPKLVTKTRRDDSRGEAWDRECKELNEMRGQEKVLRDQADAARRAAQRYQEKGSEALKRRQTYLERAKGIERDLNDLMERRKMYEENARREFVRMLRKKICEQIQTYLFGEDGAQQRIEDWMEDRLKRETKTLEEQAIEQFRIAMDCKLKWIAAVREKRTPEIMRQAQNLAKTCEALQVQRQKLEEVLK